MHSLTKNFWMPKTITNFCISIKILMDINYYLSYSLIMRIILLKVHLKWSLGFQWIHRFNLFWLFKVVFIYMDNVIFLILQHNISKLKKKKKKLTLVVACRVEHLHRGVWISRGSDYQGSSHVYLYHKLF